MRQSVGFGDVGTDRDAAWVGVLDDRDARLVEVVRRTTSGISVDIVVVGHLLAVQLLRAGKPGAATERRAVERRSLMRVLAVTQDIGSVPGRTGPGRETGALVRGRQDVAHPGRDGDVVVGGVHESARGELLTLRKCEPARADCTDDVGVGRGIRDDRD